MGNPYFLWAKLLCMKGGSTPFEVQLPEKTLEVSVRQGGIKSSTSP